MAVARRSLSAESLAWLVGYRRLQVRSERRSDILLGFLQLECTLICLNQFDAQALRRAVGAGVPEACRSAGGLEHSQGIEGEHLVGARPPPIHHLDWA